MISISSIPSDHPVLIAGPTASGKSSLALAIAETQGGVIVNADALQVFDGWRLLTARPSEAEQARAPHALYGHVPFEAAYSAGAWLRDVQGLLGQRLILVGGTGLYFRALLEGLADIPPIPDAVRAEAIARLDTDVAGMRAELAPETLARIDAQNPRRVSRAWEVQRATGIALHVWQDQTPPPTLPLSACTALVLDAPKDWLSPRIERRFDQMLAGGALEEARANLPRWSPDLPAAQAIGAPELIAHLRGEIPLETARAQACLATQQYAKRQRTWFRARMQGWQRIAAADLVEASA